MTDDDRPYARVLAVSAAIYFGFTLWLFSGDLAPAICCTALLTAVSWVVRRSSR